MSPAAQQEFCKGWACTIGSGRSCKLLHPPSTSGTNRIHPGCSREELQVEGSSIQRGFYPATPQVSKQHHRSAVSFFSFFFLRGDGLRGSSRATFFRFTQKHITDAKHLQQPRYLAAASVRWKDICMHACTKKHNNMMLISRTIRSTQLKTLLTATQLKHKPSDRFF